MLIVWGTKIPSCSQKQQKILYLKECDHISSSKEGYVVKGHSSNAHRVNSQSDRNV